ncbi:MAG: VWA domain-containing protein, partial [Acidobacteria bacterium]|nr:VWA domain-containing protein [Acidobacteriota bacterium]
RVLAHRTSDLHEALAALERVEPAVEATAFFDCVAAAVSALRAVNRPEVRRVIIALSDGEDNRSTDYRLDQVLREIQESDCLFYSINPSGRSIRINPAGLLGQQGMEAIARGTGGATFVTDRLEELDAFYKRIAAELQGQYLLGYYSPSPEGEAYRRISVRIANRPELRVRARQGYYPS